MKFLHLSDLHIGRNINNVSLLDEQKHALEQIIGYIQTERPAAVIIAGDIFNRAVPGVEALCAFDDFLTALACENVVVLLISGNHDSPERLDYASRLLSDRQLFLYGTFDGTMRKVLLTDEYGQICFWLLPFLKPSSVRGLFRERNIESYHDAVAAVLATTEIDGTIRNVLVSHQFYSKAGVMPVRSDSEAHPMGGLDAVNVRLIEPFDYAALGHLHGKQCVGSEHIRYCGSPLKYSFSEWQHDKSATLVELGPKGHLTVEALPLVPLHNMRIIKGKLNTLLSDGMSSLADKDRENKITNEDYLRAILTDETEIVDPMGKLRSVYPNIMSLDFENSRTRIDIDTLTADAHTIEKLSLYDLFSEFFLDVQGSIMTAEQASIVQELLETEDKE